jgi:rfaE bifunctional protein nucleotidyltransferase chain/domain
MPEWPRLVVDGAGTRATRAAVRDKIKSMEELGALTRQARQAGETVVLCHGVFDLLHMGHVRHLEAAHCEGTRLAVTLTADRFVNKGPNRPVFPEQLRAEMVAAIQYVDWVAINHGPSAEPVLNTLQPSVYVKGSDYRDPEEDITGKIAAERAAVEAHGGKIVFTDDITFSSSNLINRYFNVYQPELANYLETVREGGGLERLCGAIDKISDFKVLVVGDAIIDEYQYVTPLGKSPKENMIATLYQNREIFAGGAIATANHVASFCKQVDIVTCLGETESYEDLIRSTLKLNVTLNVVMRPSAPTTRKTRFVESYSMRKLFEVYSMDDTPLAGPPRAELHQILNDRLGDYDAVIVNDFGHGMLRGDTLDLLAAKSRFLGVNAQSNSANLGYNFITRYPRADYLCIDSAEAHLAAGDKHLDLTEIVQDRLPEAVNCSRIIVTRGKYGCLTRDADGTSVGVPALTSTIVDTVGAGDAFFAITAPMVAGGAKMSDIGFIGNAAGALKVGIVGHRTAVDKAALVKFVTSLLK